MSDVLPQESDFQKIYEKGETQLLRRVLPWDLETPVSAMIKLALHKTGAFLLESVEEGEKRGRYSIIGMAPNAIWRSYEEKSEINRSPQENPNGFEPLNGTPLESLREFIKESAFPLPKDLPSVSAGIFGYIGYDMIRHIERLPKAPPDKIKIPDSIFLRPSLLAVFDSVNDTMICLALVIPQKNMSAKEAYEKACANLEEMVKDLTKPLDLTTQKTKALPLSPPSSNTKKGAYLEKVRRAKEFIFAGDIFQAVISQRFFIPFPLSPFALYRSLRRVNPSPYLYYFNFENFSVVGSSPEILVRCQKGKVTVRPIAGTRPRGKNPQDDENVAQDLLSDPKERAEHLMLLDLGRNDVGRVCRIGSVHVNERFVLQYTSHLIHIVSNIEGDLKEEHDALDALIAGFPAGTVSGAPKIRAMEIIDEMEEEKRGLYAGAVGYFSANGDMDSCIALRTALIKDNVMHVQTGCGVVADSDPEYEHAESVNKAAALFHAAKTAHLFDGS